MKAISRNLLIVVLVVGGLVSCFTARVTAQPEGGSAIMAIKEKASSGGGRAIGSAESEGKTGSSRTSSALPAKNSTTSGSKPARTSPRPAPPANANAKFSGPVIGDKYSFLNFEIAEKVQPIWTLKAQSAGALGLVQVEVAIDQNGNVLSAHARTGNPLLHGEAERAALATKFNKPTANGQPARAMGFIVYRFGTEEEEYKQEQKNRQTRPGEDQTKPGGQMESVPIDGTLNGRAVSLPKPVYPAAARAAGAGGQVFVQITINENGRVISANAISGNPLLRPAAEQAAQSARFSPTQLNGKLVKVTGKLVYNFTP